jgi:acyl-CoA hydrolase
MDKKRIQDSTVFMSSISLPTDANNAGNVHGGVIMKMIDNAASVVGFKHAGTNVVTASIDRLSFHNPVFIGEVISLKASINLTGSSSMEIGVRVEAENVFTRVIKHIASAYLTFVALDKDGKSCQVPGLLLENEDEKRRNAEARDRKKVRMDERKKEEEHQKNKNLFIF